MRRVLFLSFLLLLAFARITSAATSIAIDEECGDFVPLYEALPVNDTAVTTLVCREADNLIIGAACGKKQICLFTFDPAGRKVRVLDTFEALWWDEPRLALGPDGDIFLGARRVFDKQFVFERIRERPQTPDSSYKRRDVVPAPDEVNEDAPGMPIRHYAPDGVFLAEFALPEVLAKDGVGALTVCADGTMLCGISSPGGHLFTVVIDGGTVTDHGEVVGFPERHHTRPISKTLMVGADGTVYLCGSGGAILAFDPRSAEQENIEVQLPAVVGRARFAAVDAAISLPDGTFFGGTSDGYLFRFDPEAKTIEGFGKPLRQGRICGLALGPEGVVYGVGGEPGGLARLFAFDPAARRMFLGRSPTGQPPEQGSGTFGDIGGVVCTADGTLVCAERERRGFLLVYPPAEQRMTWRHALSGEDLGNCTQDRFVGRAESSGVKLAPTYLISDTMARSSKIREPLGEGVFAKKVFQLRSGVREVEILFYGGGGSEQSPMYISVNGHKITHDTQNMLTGGWDRETIPGEYLRAGQNELIFWNAGALLVDTDAPQGHSFKGTSENGPWKSSTLGTENDARGEYVVRMRIHGFPGKGIVRSPVIDVAAMALGDEAAGLPSTVDVSGLRLSANAVALPGTSVRFELRSGTTPDYQPATWSEWLRADAEVQGPALGRFVQWRATLSSSDAALTPVLRGVTLLARGDTAGANGERVQITTTPDNAVAVSSYAFAYADPHHPRMRHLREKHGLEAVVASGQTEAEKFALLRLWVRGQWEGWNDNRYNYCPQWDALEILELAPADLGLGMCTHYAAVFTQCAAALGYHARELIVDHHCLAEIWSDQYGKWILQDPGLIPGHTVAFQYEVDGTPINALEVHQRALAGNADDVQIVPDPPRPVEDMRNQMIQLYCRFGVPLRNDHLYRPEPQELEHGSAQYHWDGYLWWTDDLDPVYPEYSLLTNRPEDFYWTLNKTILTIEDTKEAGVLSIQLSGPIPNLARFMIRTQEGEWRQSDSSFRWVLEPGKNTLEAKAVNSMALEGPVNRVEVEFASP